MREVTHADPAGSDTLYTVVRWTLVVGIALSLTLMALGLLGALLDPAVATRAGQVLPVDQLPAALLAADPIAALDLGLLTILFMPMVHLTASAIVFLRRHDGRYAAATIVVLGMLILGAVLAGLRR